MSAAQTKRQTTPNRMSARLSGRRTVASLLIVCIVGPESLRVGGVAGAICAPRADRRFTAARKRHLDRHAPKLFIVRGRWRNVADRVHAPNVVAHAVKNFSDIGDVLGFEE